jgi:hypothetical protein
MDLALLRVTQQLPSNGGLCGSPILVLSKHATMCTMRRFYRETCPEIFGEAEHFRSSVTSTVVSSCHLLLRLVTSQSQSYITADGQPASLSWNKAPIWGLRPDLDYCLTVAGLLVWGAHSDERSGPHGWLVTNIIWLLLYTVTNSKYYLLMSKSVLASKHSSRHHTLTHIPLKLRPLYSTPYVSASLVIFLFACTLRGMLAADLNIAGGCKPSRLDGNGMFIRKLFRVPHGLLQILSHRFMFYSNLHNVP